ncbi:helix-turn-helix domain-containing protein [Paenimyroides baculatum]|uniref:ImmA/IrrE family metallo-endopeptidase n=1 Tax=Paenimyroides baculatum TaxID=2608000 RepID=A0A5M6CK56_9FLAO|nr:XRE family transcriptional regulator [Paenimyroides baculatum]KAA5535611.1 ImmA/IrrE family metallo-endopeptidase [Paenimyroides baculatum]
MDIGQRIKELRVQRGLSQDDLALRANFSKSYIQKFEEGQREIKSSQMAQLAVGLGMDISEILQPVDYKSTEFNIKNIEFREAVKLDVQVEYFTKKMLGTLYKKYSSYSKLEKILGESITFSNPLKNFSVVVSNENVEEAAKILRKRWKFEDTPIYNLIIFLEDLGVKIFEVNEDDNFVGFSCWVKSTPIIVINTRNTDVSRRRFTILHELAHLLLLFSENEDKEKIERYCDQFAGAMLLPEEILKGYINSTISISLEELKRIKSKFGISILAILVRMVNIRLISWEKYKQWKEIYREWTDKESEYAGRENVSRFNYLLAKGLREELITKDLASDLSGIPMSNLSSNAINQEFLF